MISLISSAFGLDRFELLGLDKLELELLALDELVLLGLALAVVLEVCGIVGKGMDSRKVGEEKGVISSSCLFCRLAF
jgi:hypothetical protein